jgi:hypothetical protein
MEGRGKGWDGVVCGGIGKLLVKEGVGKRKQEYGVGCGVGASALQDVRGDPAMQKRGQKERTGAQSEHVEKR